MIGIGRVKTPTLAIVCRRELEIRSFVPEPYHEIVAIAAVAAGRFQMRYAPKERIKTRGEAEAIAASAEGFEGPLGVKVENKRQAPPRLHDLPSLQKLCIVPTERGLVLHGVLESADPALVDPGVTAQMEHLLDDVLVGRRDMMSAIDAVCQQASRIIGRLREPGAAGTIPSIPAAAAVPSRSRQQSSSRSSGPFRSKASTSARRRKPALDPDAGVPTETRAASRHRRSKVCRSLPMPAPPPHSAPKSRQRRERRGFARTQPVRLASNLKGPW